MGAPVHPTPLLLFTQVMGHPTGTTFPCAKAVVKNANETSWWHLHDILYFSVCHFWVLLNQGLYLRDVFWGNDHCHLSTTVIIFQRSRSRYELSEPPENSGFGQRLISKTVFSTLKALLKRFFLAAVIIHHSSKIPSRKVNTAGWRPVTLTRHFVTWNENGWREWRKECCHKYYEIRLWCYLKKQSSDVISSSGLQNIMCAPCKTWKMAHAQMRERTSQDTQTHLPSIYYSPLRHIYNNTRKNTHSSLFSQDVLDVLNLSISQLRRGWWRQQRCLQLSLLVLLLWSQLLAERTMQVLVSVCITQEMCMCVFVCVCDH